MKRIVLGVVVALALAVPASASAAQTLTITDGSQGILLTAPAAWTIDGCFGTTQTTMGPFTLLTADPGLGPNVQSVETGILSAIGASVTGVHATCDLSQWGTTYVGVLTAHQAGVNAATTTTRSHRGNCGFTPFTWGNYHALQLWCNGSSTAWAKASWRLHPPAGATSLVNDSYGTVAGKKPGTVTRSTTRNGDGSFTYTIKVTGHRAYNLAYAAVKYNTIDPVPIPTYETDTATGDWTAP